MADRITQKTVRSWMLYMGAVLWFSVLRAVWLRDEASGAMALVGTVMGVIYGISLGAMLCAKLGHDKLPHRT